MLLLRFFPPNSTKSFCCYDAGFAFNATKRIVRAFPYQENHNNNSKQIYLQSSPEKPTQLALSIDRWMDPSKKYLKCNIIAPYRIALNNYAWWRWMPHRSPNMPACQPGPHHAHPSKASLHKVNHFGISYFFSPTIQYWFEFRIVGISLIAASLVVMVVFIKTTITTNTVLV